MSVNQDYDVAFFRLVAAISAEFVLSSANEVDDVINKAIARIGMFYGADRCYVFMFSADLVTASNTHEWCASDVSPQKSCLQNLASAEFGGWFSSWQEGEISRIADISVLEHTSNEYQLLASQGIKSLLMIPLRSNTRLIGMFGIDMVKQLQGWPEAEVAGLSLIAGNICGVLLRKEAEEKAESLAFYDPVTGLANRQLMLDRIEQAQRQSHRNQFYVALLFIDVDDFKTLNDSLGFTKGDEVLKLIGQALQSVLPQGDTIGRFSADEFLVLSELFTAERCKAVQAITELAASLQHTVISNQNLMSIREKNTISIGCTLFLGGQHDTDVLITQADLATYQVKQAGGNGLSFFDITLQEQANQRLNLAKELRQALNQAQFELFYQPQLVHPGVVLGAEVLLRWRHPERGLLGPDAFIRFAEETGLIVEIGEYVLFHACKQLAVWQQTPSTARLELSVNISAKQLKQANFSDKVLDIIKHTAIDASALKLELTESVLVEDFDNVVGIMQILQAKGIRFSLDDFGTGYSSLVYLKRLPLYQLKVDRSFVADLLTDENDQAIAKMIILLGQTLGLEVMAEGVETVEQLKTLFKLGCYHYQGYYFSKPLPLNLFEHYLAKASGGLI
ncbi:putative bifunctional diguanylate cyclase/phosphodiesterase [Alishewanella sp. HL-SH05]|uniref:putative bifunctional diguanylate cyclase/phosphodiesterase n=1 Tax=Alishewanella sp. HL-SH05 TaxID=3461145 RepID=UPI0040411E4E